MHFVTNKFFHLKFQKDTWCKAIFKKFVYDVSNPASRGGTSFCLFLSSSVGEILVSIQHQEKLLYICLICLKYSVLLSQLNFSVVFVLNLSISGKKMYQVGSEQPTDENGPSFLGALLSTLCMTFQAWEMTIPVLPSPLTIQK